MRFGQQNNRIFITRQKEFNKKSTYYQIQVWENTTKTTFTYTFYILQKENIKNTYLFSEIFSLYQEQLINIKRYICNILNLNNVSMKGLNVLAAFLGGAAIGATLGILFAPEKGEDTRQKIAEILRKKGIRLNRNEMENLVDEIAAEIKGEVTE